MYMVTVEEKDREEGEDGEEKQTVATNGEDGYRNWKTYPLSSTC